MLLWHRLLKFFILGFLLLQFTNPDLIKMPYSAVGACFCFIFYAK